VTLYRTTHPYFPFIWESDDQPPARWHGEGEGPVHYFATTPEGAWAELLRHEEIIDPEDLKGLNERAIWVVQLTDPPDETPSLDFATLTGGRDTYPACRAEAQRLRGIGSKGFVTESAALQPAGAMLFRVNDGLRYEAIESKVVVLFGPQPHMTAQLVALGRPPERLLEHVRHL